MASRTKEALLAQHAKALKAQGKRRKQFSLIGTPDSTTLILVVVGIVLIVLPFIVPDLGKDLYRGRITGAVSKLELNNDVYTGQFKLTPRSGDTKPNTDANFWAIYVLKANNHKLKNEATAQAQINQRHESSRFGKQTKDIHQGIQQFKSLGLLSNANRAVDSYYDQLLSMTERNSGFKLNDQYTASVEATYYAFEAIKELNKFDEFQKREEFSSALRFVASMKDADNKGGFRNKAGENATVLATWQAVQILSRSSSKDADTSARAALEGVEKFIYSCQAADGGFANTPIESAAEMYHSHSSAVTTAQALYVLETLREKGLVSFNFAFGEVNPLGIHYDAISYLRSCLSLSNGIVRSFPGSALDLESAYYFTRLVERFPSISFGTPRTFQLSLVGAGVLSILIGLFIFVKPRLPRGSTREVQKTLLYSAVFLSVAAITVSFYPIVAFAVYLFYAVFLAIRFFEVAQTDTTEGLVFVVSFCHSFCYLGMVFLLSSVNPIVFGNLKIFYLLAVWEVLSTFLVTVVAAYTTGVSKISFFVQAAFLSWIVNTALFYAMVYGKGEMEAVYRMIVVHGHVALVFVVLPLVSLLVVYGLSAYASYHYLEWQDSSDAAAVAPSPKPAVRTSGGEKSEEDEDSDKKVD